MTKPKAKKTAYAEVLALLSKFSERLDAQAGRTTTTIREQAGLRETVIALNTKQAETNRATTDSLYKLRDSTQIGFDGVRTDVKSLLTTVQRLNERVVQVESQNFSLVTVKNIQIRTIDALQTRIQVLESFNQALRDTLAAKE